MRPTSKAFVLLVLFLILVSSGTTVEGILGNGVNRIHKFQKDDIFETSVFRKQPRYLYEIVMREIPRKLMVVDAMLDYDYAGPNPRHDPRKRGGNNHP